MSNEELAIRIQNGEKELISALWEKNRGIIHRSTYSLYTRYRDRCISSGVTPDDVIQVSYFALLDAVEAYESGSGYKLTTYLRYPLKNHFDALIGLRTSKRNPINQCASLDVPIVDGEDIYILDTIEDTESQKPFEDTIEGMANQQLREILEIAISKLSNVCAVSVRERYLQGKDFSVIADETGEDIANVKKWVNKALRHLGRDMALIKRWNEEFEAFAYRHIGVKAFNTSWDSSVERAVIKAEELTKGKHGYINLAHEHTV